MYNPLCSLLSYATTALGFESSIHRSLSPKIRYICSSLVLSPILQTKNKNEPSRNTIKLLARITSKKYKESGDFTNISQKKE
jgi:hypothetical protein